MTTTEKALRDLAAKWRAEAMADAGDYYGDQFETRDRCADELEALLSAPPPPAPAPAEPAGELPPDTLCACGFDLSMHRSGHVPGPAHDFAPVRQGHGTGPEELSEKITLAIDELFRQAYAAGAWPAVRSETVPARSALESAIRADLRASRERRGGQS